jgi:uncharacterized membrane protein
MIGYIIFGVIIGGYLAGSGGEFAVGMTTGGVIGWLIHRLQEMARRIESLEAGERSRSRDAAPRWGGAKTESAPSSGGFPEDGSPEPVAETPIPEPAITDPWGTEPDRGSAQDHGAPSRPSLLQSSFKVLAGWFTTGNVPVKIGVIVTFIGVSFLLKYAIDHELLVMPIEFRLAAVALFGLALTSLGWRLRQRNRVYSLSLQGGGLGILFLVTFAAFRIWQLLPATVAFGLLVILTVVTGALAVLQNSRWLAILGISGGFLAPVLTSTGQGSHVVLFSYYLLLNCAILGISWFRSWQSLNLVGFVLTFVIGVLWGERYYQPALADSTMPFLWLHFLLYHAIAILFALRQPPERLGIVDGTLVFGTPAVVFALQAELVKGSEYGLAISAAIVAVFYALTALVLHRNRGKPLSLLIESYLALAVAFATMAIPLALDARWTAAAWALEGAALIWIGMRQQRHLPNLAGTALIGLSGLSFMEHGWRGGIGLPVLNGNVLGGVLISLSSLFGARRLKPLADGRFLPLYHLATLALFGWGLLWWLGTGLLEIMDRPTRFNEAHVFVLFLAASFGGGAWIGRWRDWQQLRFATFGYLPLLALPAVYTWVTEQHFMFGLGWLAWPLAWVAQWIILKLLDEDEGFKSGTWHFISLIAFAAFVSLESYWQVEKLLSDVWGIMIGVTLPGVLAILTWRLRRGPEWPVPAHPAHYLHASLVLVAAQVILLTAFSIENPGHPAPLPYIPLMNPFGLAMVFAAVTSLLSIGAIRAESAADETLPMAAYRPAWQWMLIALFLILTTTALVRGVHHYAGVQWSSHALYHSVIVQTSLSIYWGLLGFIGMIWGARRRHRPIWLAGAGFMGLVVLKLFAVDLGNTGTVERIVSFMGIGALLLVVGYFAPAPPRADQKAE